MSAPSPRRARLGVSVMFFTNGVLFAGLLPRYPEVKSAFGLSDTAFGLLVIAFPVGAILAAGAAGPLIRRVGARAVTVAGSALLALFVALAGASPGPLLFAGALLVAGLVDAVVDAAQNVQGVVVEEWGGRSIINSLHALWSLGATAGGLIGTAAAARDVPLGVQLAVNGAVWAVVAAGAAVLAAAPHPAAHLAPHPAADVGAAGDAQPAAAGGGAAAAADGGAAAAADGGTPAAASGGTAAAGGEPGVRPGAGPRPWLLLAPLVVLAICGTLMEEFANSWSALFMVREAGAPAAVAGLGFTAMLASQFAGRLVGDPMTDRWGRDAVARSGGVLVAAGVLLAMVGLGYGAALAGLALMGFGSATLVPAAFAAAGRVPGLPHGTGIAVLGWLMRLGFLLTSPVIGLISDAAGLRTALLVPLAAGLLAAALAHRSAQALRAQDRQ